MTGWYVMVIFRIIKHYSTHSDIVEEHAVIAFLSVASATREIALNWLIDFSTLPSLLERAEQYSH